MKRHTTRREFMEHLGFALAAPSGFVAVVGGVNAACLTVGAPAPHVCHSDNLPLGEKILQANKMVAKEAGNITSQTLIAGMALTALGRVTDAPLFELVVTRRRLAIYGAFMGMFGTAITMRDQRTKPLEVCDAIHAPITK